MPTGVRTPVAIMSMRARAGAVQALVQPGRRTDLSSSSTSSAVVRGVLSGQRIRSIRRSGSGAQAEYHRIRASFGHSERGRRRMVVSAIEYGAGSVPVSARPTLPNTVRTSPNLLMARSCQNSCVAACSGGAPGNVVGMYSRSPSSIRGRNSPPRRDTMGKQEASASNAVARVSVGRLSAKWTNGR